MAQISVSCILPPRSYGTTSIISNKSSNLRVCPTSAVATSAVASYAEEGAVPIFSMTNFKADLAFNQFGSREKNAIFSELDVLRYASFGICLSNALADLSGNHIFMSAFWSWLIAQVAKLFTSWYREGNWDYRVMFDSGGMPSSHTALVVGLTTAIAHKFGLGSVYFPMSLAFSLIVMYDAAGVRRHAGKQAEVLNKIVEDMFHGSAISNTKLKEVLGHSPLQVICGAIVGVAVGTFYMLKYSYS